MLTKKQALAAYTIRQEGYSNLVIDQQATEENSAIRAAMLHKEGLVGAGILQDQPSAIYGPDAYRVNGDRLVECWTEWWNANPTFDPSSFDPIDLV